MWRNLCSGWASLKKCLSPRVPSNIEEWGDLPLWRPHVNHVEAKLVRCNTIAQRSLKQAGFQFMADILGPDNVPIQWDEALQRGAPANCEQAFTALTRNLKIVPEIGPPETDKDLFLEESSSGRVWQYRVAARRATERWIPFMNLRDPTHTFRTVGSMLSPIAKCSPPIHAQLHRIMVRAPWHSGRLFHLGRWQREHLMLNQYDWQDGTSMLHSSTAQLRLMQVHGQAAAHRALQKWNRQLGTPVPDEIWTSTWLPYRSAAENTFLWQMIYRIPATNHWRLPDRPASDPDTWCPRCDLHVLEDTLHCIWACVESRKCWDWCSSILAWVTERPRHRIQLEPANVLIAVALPAAWDTPARLWHTLRAILCWIIWKERNNVVFGGETTNVHRIVGLAWHRLGIYVKMAWKECMSQVRAGKITLSEASIRMEAFFGPPGKIWTLHEIQIQVPPVPPRPP